MTLYQGKFDRSFWSFFDFGLFWPKKCIFLHFTPEMTEGPKITVKGPKVHFLGQNRKKWRKRPQLIFQLYMKISSPNFFGGPPGLRKWHYLLFLLVSEVLTHLPIIYGSCGDGIRRENLPAIFFHLICLMDRREVVTVVMVKLQNDDFKEDIIILNGGKFQVKFIQILVFKLCQWGVRTHQPNRES